MIKQYKIEVKMLQRELEQLTEGKDMHASAMFVFHINIETYEI